MPARNNVTDESKSESSSVGATDRASEQATGRRRTTDEVRDAIGSRDRAAGRCHRLSDATKRNDGGRPSDGASEWHHYGYTRYNIALLIILYLVHAYYYGTRCHQPTEGEQN